MKINLQSQEKFEDRHHGKDAQELSDMLQTLGVGTLDELIDPTVPAGIGMAEPLKLPPALSERAFLRGFKRLASENQIFKSYIGQGYYDTITPPVILRNILENPGWYTAYTPVSYTHLDVYKRQTQ